MSRAVVAARVLPVVGVLAASVAPLSASAHAGATHAAATAGNAASSSVTVFLRAPHPAALSALARATGLGTAQRRARLERLLPSAAEHRAAISGLRAEGLTVTDQTSWSVTASGPAARLDAVFGSRPALSAHPSARELRAHTGAVPTTPEALGSVAQAVLPDSSTGPALYHPQTLLSGTDFRRAYTSPALTSAATSPYDGTDPDGSLTVATIQLSNWTSSDLTGYASHNGLTLRPGQYTPVTVGSGAVDREGAVEVDLDQESILSTDPHANQRAYFASDRSAAAFNQAFGQVLDDVLQDGFATGGGDPHIGTLSTSWGLCEAFTGDAARDSLEPILKSLTAAGVTVFAASGDDGIYDCRSSLAGGTTKTPDVDFPASSPWVVGVGGTSLAAVGASRANSGSNWTETAWGCSSSSACEGSSGGSGGGASTAFAEPSWQRADIANPTYTGVGRRLVPDIAVDGAPNSGFQIFSTRECGGQRQCKVGGTSLSSPMSAALLTDTLAHYGRTSGIGDIHQGLYDAFAATRTTSAPAFRDVTSGQNGAIADIADSKDPSVSSATGYDTVTGLGAPLWPAVAPYLLDTSTRPRARVGLRLASPTSRTAPRRLTATWSLPATGHGAGGRQASVTITRVGHHKPVFRDSTAAPAGGHSFTGARGATYRVTVTGTAVSGAVAVPGKAGASVPIDDRSFRFRGAWRRVAGASDNAGSHAQTSVTGASATVRAVGKRYALRVRTGPSQGRLAVFVHGHRLRTINLFAAHAGHRTVRILAAKSRHSRVFSFRCLGTKSHASRGTTVDVDALDAT